MPRTPLYDLPFPDEYSAADVPVDVEALARRIDQLAGMFFPGDLKMSAAEAPPPGWLLCDGREVARDAYAALFEAIGTRHGGGDGSTTFNLPAYRGRMPIGAGQGPGLADRPLGGAGGAETHTLSVAELASHPHGVSDPTHAHSVADPTHAHWSNAGLPFFDSRVQWRFSGNDIPLGHSGGTAFGGVGVGIYGAYTGVSVNPAGGNGAHNNMPPFVAVNFFIKT
jgi:microcystin-dependent protein